MKYKKTAVILFITTICTIVFIWGNSFMPQAQSIAISGFVLKTLRATFNFGAADTPANATNLLREWAHVIEFFGLGFQLCALALVSKKLSVLKCFIVVLAISLVDEILQLFNDRSAQIVDILKDFFGATAGILTVYAIYKLIKLIKAKKFRTK